MHQRSNEETDGANRLVGWPPYPRAINYAVAVGRMHTQREPIGGRICPLLGRIVFENSIATLGPTLLAAADEVIEYR